MQLQCKVDEKEGKYTVAQVFPIDGHLFLKTKIPTFMVFLKKLIFAMFDYLKHF